MGYQEIAQLCYELGDEFAELAVGENPPPTPPPEESELTELEANTLGAVYNVGAIHIARSNPKHGGPIEIRTNAGVGYGPSLPLAWSNYRDRVGYLGPSEVPPEPPISHEESVLWREFLDEVKYPTSVRLNGRKDRYYCDWYRKGQGENSRPGPDRIGAVRIATQIDD